MLVVACCVTSGTPNAAVAAPQGSLLLDRTDRPNGAIGLIGDSLTYSYFDGIDDSFRAQQWGPIGIEARSSRRTLVAHSLATSGIDAIRRLRTLGFDAPIWIVALGTNDISSTTYSTAVADELIDTMIAEIGANRRVVWVNVFAKSSSSRARAVEFNDRLIVATERHPLLTIVDWYSLALAHPGWFVDNVHTNLTGAIARNELVASAALIQPCTGLPSAPAPSAPGPLPGAATATAMATGRCRVTSEMET